MSSVTVSIVSHGQADLVRQLLGDLARLQPPALGRVVVTLNRPEDFSLDGIALNVPLAVVHNRRPLGFAANHNQAFQHCTTELFAVLNPDLCLIEDPFPALLQALTEPQAVLAVPHQVDENGHEQDFVRSVPTPWQLLRRRLGLKPAQRPEWVPGAFMLFKSSAYRELGGFDPRFHLYCEDTELCMRLRLAGYRFVIASDATVGHWAQRASKRSLQHLFWHATSLCRLWTSPTYWRYRELLMRESQT